jgi:hypothetical protein
VGVARAAEPRFAGASTICLGSKAYLDEAAKRLLANCADGVTYLMYDGDWYQGGCDDATHGHPVPFTKEDHMRANLLLARRVHEKYPHVLIEMHDMMMGGSNPRNTPVYYKYGLPGSYDDNWGFELMWNPMDDITSGRARSLYYYNLGCNVPIYLHIDLRKDRPGLPVLWWYASTCRHLGIGGTHKNPAVAAAQKAAMHTYHAWERFFKRGEFYGANEEVHFHVLPEENAFVVNLFNLSDQKRVIGWALRARGSQPARTTGVRRMAARRKRTSARWKTACGRSIARWRRGRPKSSLCACCPSDAARSWHASKSSSGLPVQARQPGQKDLPWTRRASIVNASGCK